MISNQPADFYVNGDVIECVTMGSITLGSDITIPDGVVFDLVSPKVSIQEDISVLLGSELHINTRRHPINDTGIVNCSDDDTNNLVCPVASHPGQDAAYGRDVNHNDDSDGHAGFSFSKICNSGELAGEGTCPFDPIPGNGADDWACNKDNVTGLIWEVKTNDGGLRDKDSLYSWYNPDSNSNGGDAGTQNGGNCTGSSCDTLSYVQAVNAQGLCGANDWRMPFQQELRNITSIDRVGPAIDTVYFPNTHATYWSASPKASSSNDAWSIHSLNGSSSASNTKSFNGTVRLVRGAP